MRINLIGDSRQRSVAAVLVALGICVLLTLWLWPRQQESSPAVVEGSYAVSDASPGPNGLDGAPHRLIETVVDEAHSTGTNQCRAPFPDPERGQGGVAGLYGRRRRCQRHVDRCPRHFPVSDPLSRQGDGQPMIARRRGRRRVSGIRCACSSQDQQAHPALVTAANCCVRSTIAMLVL